MNENITRVDVEKWTRDGVMLKMWQVGWSYGDPPTQTMPRPGTTVFEVVRELEKEGFTVEMVSMDEGRALRGKITRVDFYDIGNGEWKVVKYPYGWTARTHPIETKIHQDFDIDKTIQWCIDHGWQIRHWVPKEGLWGGYRAFRYKLEPVRDAFSIQALRTRHQYAQYDFAFDY